jgi:hypothetical protein
MDTARVQVLLCHFWMQPATFRHNELRIWKKCDIVRRSKTSGKRNMKRNPHTPILDPKGPRLRRVYPALRYACDEDLDLRDLTY